MDLLSIYYILYTIADGSGHPRFIHGVKMYTINTVRKQIYDLTHGICHTGIKHSFFVIAISFYYLGKSRR